MPVFFRNEKHETKRVKAGRPPPSHRQDEETGAEQRTCELVTTSTSDFAKVNWTLVDANIVSGVTNMVHQEAPEVAL